MLAAELRAQKQTIGRTDSGVLAEQVKLLGKDLDDDEEKKVDKDDDGKEAKIGDAKAFETKNF